MNQSLLKSIKQNRTLVLMAMPALLYFAVFHYAPMIGAGIAFQDFRPGMGLLGGKFVGLKWFLEFAHSEFFSRLLTNTFLLSFYTLLFSFPAPVIFALLLNEAQNKMFKNAVQVISYLPHFVSLVVVVGILQNLLSPSDGLMGAIRARLGLSPLNFMQEPRYFRTLYIATGIWQELGWSSIVYFAAISSIDTQLYEAAKIDGCNRIRQALHVTLPGIAPTAMTLLILALGGIMNVGHEKILLMYSPSTYGVADVISTYVYRRGVTNMQYSYGAAVGFFNSVINLVLLLAVNAISKKASGVGLF